MPRALFPAIQVDGDLLTWRRLSVWRSKLVRDLFCPRIDVRPVAVIARVPAESFEQDPSPCGSVIEINDSRKDTIVAGVKRSFQVADILRLLLDQFADNRVSIAERSNTEQPEGLAGPSTAAYRRMSSFASAVHDPSYTPLPNTTAS